MAGVSVEIVASGLNEAVALIEGIANAPKHELLENWGRLTQEQTRRRIAEEKTSPDGAAWPPSRSNPNTLLLSGALMNSIDYAAGADQVETGSGLIYASVHQDGATIKAKDAKALAFMIGNEQVFAQSVTIPARPFLGLSADNAEELIEATEDWVRSLIQ